MPKDLKELLPDHGAERTIKTTINIPENLWKDFSIEVIREHGGRMKNDVIVELIQNYLDTRKKGK